METCRVGVFTLASLVLSLAIPMSAQAGYAGGQQALLYPRSNSDAAVSEGFLESAKII